MGNTFSSPNQTTDIKSLSSHIDDIAIHYILKQNTIDLLRLTDKEYYDNLIVLVSNLFDRRLSDMEIGSIYHRIFPEKIQDAVQNILPSNEKIKNNMISNISKFYIKIMMIFSAIVATIDPQYSYEDDDGTKQLFYLKDIHSYKNIPKHVQPMVHQLTNPMNLCRKRISILRNKMDFSDPDFITINPGEKICSTDSTSHLTDEIGIKELDLLYYDVFDPTTKTWKSRSPEMEQKYKDDIKKFFTVFTGKEVMPDNIKSFKDIELFDFKSIEYCRDALFTHDFIIPKDNHLIVRYKEQLELLEKSTSEYRNKLISIIKRIFLTKIVDDNTTYSIQPKLTLDEILKIEQDTRITIIDLYTHCEKYFIRALLIFEELYDTQSKSVNESRMTKLENIPLYQDTLIHSNNPDWTNKPKSVTIFPETIKEGMTNIVQPAISDSKSIPGMPVPVPTSQNISALSEPIEPFTMQPKTVNYISPPISTTIPQQTPVDLTQVMPTSTPTTVTPTTVTPMTIPEQIVPEQPPVEITQVSPVQITMPVTSSQSSVTEQIVPTTLEQPSIVTPSSQEQPVTVTPSSQEQPVTVTPSSQEQPVTVTQSPPEQPVTVTQSPPEQPVTVTQSSQEQPTSSPEQTVTQSPQEQPPTGPDQPSQPSVTEQIVPTTLEQPSIVTQSPPATSPLQIPSPEQPITQSPQEQPPTGPEQPSQTSPTAISPLLPIDISKTVTQASPIIPEQMTNPQEPVNQSKNIVQPNPQNSETNVNPQQGVNQSKNIVQPNPQNSGEIPNPAQQSTASIKKQNTVILPKPMPIPEKGDETIMEKISNIWNGK